MNSVTAVKNSDIDLAKSSHSILFALTKQVFEKLLELMFLKVISTLAWSIVFDKLIFTQLTKIFPAL